MSAGNTIREADPVRALTVRQPWADALAYLGKDVENRSRRTTYTGQLYLHAGLGTDRAACLLLPADAELPGTRGAVIAVARISGCHRCDGECSEWAFAGSWHWQISHVVPLSTPVTARGRLGLWIPDASLRARVNAALPATLSPRQRARKEAGQ